MLSGVSFRGDVGPQESLSAALTDKCRINSFTFLELAEEEGKRTKESKDSLSVLSDGRSYNRERDKQVLFERINQVPAGATTGSVFIKRCKNYDNFRPSLDLGSTTEVLQVQS